LVWDLTSERYGGGRERGRERGGHNKTPIIINQGFRGWNEKLARRDLVEIVAKKFSLIEKMRTMTL